MQTPSTNCIKKNTGERYGCIDLLILNAGVAKFEPIATLGDTTSVREQMQTNYVGFVAGIIYALP